VVDAGTDGFHSRIAQRRCSASITGKAPASVLAYGPLVGGMASAPWLMLNDVMPMPPFGYTSALRSGLAEVT
jgi:hypothetical protein